MIKRIKLHRFKQFKDSDISLLNGLNLLAGGNNSGKSSILHALAIWEFCKTILELEKGHDILLSTAHSQGIGIGDDEFSPINVPTLRHLWTNLKTQKIDEPDGYTLKIKAFWDDNGGNEKHLEFGLSLVNDRLFIKVTSSNLGTSDTTIPKVAYLPPFAGITDKESRLTPAMRNRLIGQGLSGAVIRNILYDMWASNQTKRRQLRGDKSKIKGTDLKRLRETDPWELLSAALANLFSCGLTIRPFNEQYHTYINIECWRGKIRGKRFLKLAGYTSRDLMVEGSGFLQWLSVYALALVPDVNVILLDEPDAHLHSSLQKELMDRLAIIIDKSNKQVLSATHSTELIKSFASERILQVSRSHAKYLSEENQKVGLLAGLGSEYSPRLNALQVSKKVLFVESDIDEKLIRIWADTLSSPLPQSIVVWVTSTGHKERKQLFLQLGSEIRDLRAISLRDRDDEPDRTVNVSLVDKSHPSIPAGFIALKWRRRHIENYLMHQKAIAIAASVNESLVKQYFQDTHSLSLPANFADSNVSPAIRDARGKQIIAEGKNSVVKTFKISRESIARNMELDEIPDDIKKLIDYIIELTNS